jgi:DNA-nicking Smr family endonuclease
MKQRALGLLDCRFRANDRVMGRQRDETDAELWARVARSARPLEKGRSVTPVVKSKARAREPAEKPSPPPVKIAPKALPKPAPVARGEALDRHTARRLERGRLPVEARLDLHGMRQRDAHAALRRFLKAAQGKGYRHVLVITGKGAEPSARQSFYAAEERGVLRQAVPHWLGQPDLAPVVISYSEAPRRLGGEGALYVRLRAAKRS